MAVADLYLPDECWERVFRILKADTDDRDDDYNNLHFYCLSLVCKQFLSITNRLLFSHTLYNPTFYCLGVFFQRFPNVTSLKLCGYEIYWIYRPSKITIKYPPTNGSNSPVVIPQLKSLHLTSNKSVENESIKVHVSVFPNLQLLNLSYCYYITEAGILHVLRTCSNLRHLNLTCCLGVGLRGLNFEVPKLEVLNLSHTFVDDETLYAISKNCCGLLELYLENCCVTEKGVMSVVENCTQLREINLKHCRKVHADIVASKLISLSKTALLKVEL